jgi:S1-C subfamily serine protease
MAQEKISQVIKKVLPAVVSITISKYLPILENPLSLPFLEFEEFFALPKERKKVKVGGGSGFIVDSSGIILTNRHIIDDPQAEYIVILTDGRKFKPQILARDPLNDIAILKIETKNLPTLELGDSDNLELGETVIAIGNTLGIFPNTVSVGVISGLSREISTDDELKQRTTKLRGLIQTDAAINPGNSGGPLVNLEGKAIGINVAMVFLAQNVSFALPINLAKKDLEEIKKYQRIRQPFLGVRYILLNKNLKRKFNLPLDYGALVISEQFPLQKGVAPQSPAEKAGIKEGDIILEISSLTKNLEKEIISENNPLEEVLQKFKVGEEVLIKIFREGKEKLLKARLEEKK